MFWVSCLVFLNLLKMAPWVERISVTFIVDMTGYLAMMFGAFVQVFFCSWSTGILKRCLFPCRRNNSQKIMTEIECILTSTWSFNWNGMWTVYVRTLTSGVFWNSKNIWLCYCYDILLLSYTSVEASCLVIVFLAMLVCMLALSIRTCFYTKEPKTISSMVLLRRKYYHTFLFFLSYSAHLLHKIKVVLSILKPSSVLSYKPFLPRIKCRTRTLKLPIIFHKGWCQTASRSSRSLATWRYLT